VVEVEKRSALKAQRQSHHVGLASEVVLELASVVSSPCAAKAVVAGCASMDGQIHFG